MKVYVDELPSCCEECPLRSYMCDSYWCSAYEGDKILFADEVKEANLCPLQSLSDYTKQVRKEVVQEIWKEFEQRLMNKTPDMTIMKVANMINSVLDQIQGE